MSDGRLCVVLDPVGYQYASEEGIAFNFDGQNLWSQATLLPEDNLFSADGSVWIGPQVRQFSPEWWDNEDRAAHMLLRENWVFASGVTVSEEYLDTKAPIAPPERYRWMGLHTPPTITDPPMNVNFHLDGINARGISPVLEKERKVRLPGGTDVIAATAGVLPARKFPFWRIGEYPPPDTIFIVGWGEYALVLGHKTIYLLKTTDDHQNWELLADTNITGKWMRYKTHEHIVTRNYFQNPPMPVYSAPRRMAFHEFGVVPVGLDELMIAGITENAGTLQVRKPYLPRTGLEIAADGIQKTQNMKGRWWLACSPGDDPRGRQAMVQVEKLAYEFAEHITQYELDHPITSEIGLDPFLYPNFYRSQVMFALGSYEPTPPPQIEVDGFIHSNAGIEETSLLSGEGNLYGVEHEASEGGEKITLKLVDRHFNPWDNSTSIKQSSGHLHFRIDPHEDGESCPQIRLMTVKFDPVLTDRVRSLTGSDETIITDLSTGTYPTVASPSRTHYHWRNWRAASSRSEFLGKLFEVEIVETVYRPASILFSSGSIIEVYATRQRFPLEIREDIDANGSYEQKRFRGWVMRVEQIHVEWQDMDGDGAPDTLTRVWKIRGMGLAKRLDQPWLFLHAVQNPSSAGRITHLEAIRNSIRQGGSDPDNGFFFYGEEINGDPEQKKYLPGDVRHRVAVSGLRERKNPYEPDPDQERASYMVTVAKTWAGRDLFERLDGQIRYVRDLIFDIFQFGGNQLGQLPAPAAVFYRSHDEALANAATEVAANRTPGLFFLDDPPPEIYTLGVQGNAVRVTGKNSSGEELKTLIVRDMKSIRGVQEEEDGPYTANYENFVGEPKIVTIETDFAMDENAQSQVGWAMLRQLLLRGSLIKGATPFLPWGCRPGILALDVGDVMRVAGPSYGPYGDYVIVHTEVVADSHWDKATVYTGWKFPTPLAMYQEIDG